MPINVEYKAVLSDRPQAERLALALSGAPPVILVQRDTYYQIPEGRLKLREESRDGVTQPPILIRYSRADDAGTRDSHYTLEPLASPPAYPVWLIVEKTRRFSLAGQVRIHIDKVQGLGDYIEFESLVNEHQTHAQAVTALQDVLDRFKPVLGAPIDSSYSALREAALKR